VTFNYLEIEDIFFINKMMIEKYGGNFIPPNNLLHYENLEYLIEIVKTEMFGAPLYPEINHNTGLYMFNIICNHIFQDGNKRTGLEASLLFLKLNHFHLSPNAIDETLINFTTEVAEAKHTLETVQDWFKNNIVKI